MKHLKDGQLRAYYDGALCEDERARIQAHLALCPRCAKRASAIQMRGMRVSSMMESLDPIQAAHPVATEVAHSHFSTYINKKKEHTMFGNLFSRRYRLAWAGAALALVLTLVFVFPPARTLADNFLALFRVQKIEMVEFDPEALPSDAALDAAARRFESVMEDQVRVESEGESQVIDVATAKASSVFPVRFPAVMETEPRVVSQPGSYVSMQLDLANVRALFSELGYEDVDLPDSLDGATFSVDFSSAVMARYGACEGERVELEAEGMDGDDLPACTTFTQMPVPSVSAPPELDVQQLGQVYLQLMGMDAEYAARFSQRVDWTTTLLVPVPSSQGFEYEEVAVDGVTGMLLVQSPENSYYGTPDYMLLWIKNDVVYWLSGSGDALDALQIAASLE